MADKKTEIVVYQGSDQGGLTVPAEPVTARNAPAIVKEAGRSAAREGLAHTTKRPAACGGG